MTTGIRCTGRTAFAVLAWAALLIGAAPGGALAQGLDLFSGGSDPLAGTTAEREAVLETLDTSFVREQLVRLERAREKAGDDAVPFDPGEALEGARNDYLDAASERLYALEGDGSLTLGEVAAELPPIREEHIRRFENVVEARSLGYAPPPLRDAFDSLAAYVVAATRYIVSTRNSAASWGRLALYAAAGVLIALALSWLMKRLSSGVADREHFAFASAIDSLRAPLVLGAAATGLLIGLDILWLPVGVERVVRSTLEIAVVALAFLACWNLCDELAGILSRAVQRATGRESVDHAHGLIQRTLRVIVVAAFLVVVSRVVLGVSLTGLLAGLGIVGVGLWFLTRGLVENVAASFTLFGDRVFRIGDTVIHSGEWGVIEDIGFRSTRCRTLDGHMLHIPNRNLVDETIRNVSARSGIRSRFRLSLLYDTSPAKIEEAGNIVRAVIEEQGDRVNRDAGVHVVFDAFGAWDLQLLVQYFTASDDYWTGKAVIGEVNTEIRRRFEEADIGFAFPTRTTVLESDPDAPPLVSVEGAIERPDEGDADDEEETRSSGTKNHRESGEARRRDGFDEEGRDDDGDDGDKGEGDGGGDGR